MPSVLGQVGQNVASDLFEIGKSAVKGTASVVPDVVHESIEQIAGSGPLGAVNSSLGQGEVAKKEQTEKTKREETRRLEEVKRELATFIERKKQLDKKIAEENASEGQRERRAEVQRKQERESWVKKLINRSQTGTERGRLTE